MTILGEGPLAVVAGAAAMTLGTKVERQFTKRPIRPEPEGETDAFTRQTG